MSENERIGLLILFGAMLVLFELFIRLPINANLRRIASFYRAHAESRSANEPIALILRSFGQVHGYLDQGSGFSVLWLLDDALRSVGLRPVLLGTETPLPADHGTLLFPSNDNSWQAIFERFAEAAAVIIFVPETTQSLTTELRVMADRGWLAKTILVMTPESIAAPTAGGEFVVSGDDAKRRSRWDDSRVVMSEHGISMPPYDKRGALVEMTAEGKAETVTVLSIDAPSLQPSGFWGEIVNSPRPNMPERWERFRDKWRQIHDRRRFSGISIHEVYRQIAPNLPNLTLRDVFSPPGDDGVLLFNLKVTFLGMGWGAPLFLILIQQIELLIQQIL
jgi:hypothetical protein